MTMPGGACVRRRGEYKLVAWGICLLLYALLQSNAQQPSTALPTTPKWEEEMTTASEESVEESPTGKSLTVLPTWRPRRLNCTPPAIEQFPWPIIGPEARRHGAIIIHIIICVYSFIGLAIICDNYFVTTLDRICEELRLSPDVAGATFMAAGSSAPELATVVIGVFFAKDDIGVSGVIGSAVFNIMFVISVCALFAGTVSYLNWWPLCRDCFFYCLSIIIMICVIYDETISWGESVFMLITYVGYCVALAYNPALEAWALTLPVPCKEQQLLASQQHQQQSGANVEDTHLVSYKSLQEKQQPMFNSYGGTEPAQDEPITSPTNCQEMGLDPHHQNQGPEHKKVADYYKGSNVGSQACSLIKPETIDRWILFKWYSCYPIHFLAQNTMPDLTQEKYKNWYPFTFLVSMIWISFYSYIMVWMITLIGSTLGIPDTVMGLTFVAAGVSVPDALSSLAVVKEGYSDMAVSNAVGSNVFDILICLGLPWFLQTAVIKPGSHVNVYSRGLMYSTVSLLSTVVFLVVATHLNGWKLDKKYGIILMLWYVLFICFASLYELNVFGYMNPPECASDY